MNPSELPKSVTGKKGRKSRPQEPESRPVEPMQAKDAADKQAMDLHSGVQDLSRRAELLEIQVDELDAELKSARDAVRAADAHAAELAGKASRVDDLELQVATLQKQIDQLQSWSAELSAKAEKAAVAEKLLREELAKAQEQHVTVVRAKDEKVAALEDRAKEGLKRIKDAHDSALREQAARATASEKEAREELKKLQDLHASAMQEAGPLRSQIAELRAQLEKSGELRKDVDALSQQIGQVVGARDKMRRELDEARSLLNHTRDELKKAQDLGTESERTNAALRMQVTDLERKAKEAAKEDPRIATLKADVQKAQEESAGLRTKVADLEKKARELPREDPRVATLTGEVKRSQERVAELERKVRELPREDPRIVGLAAELKKAQDLRSASEQESAGLKTQSAALREELKRAQDQRRLSERDVAALKSQLADLQRKSLEASKEDPRLGSLAGDLKKVQEENAGLRTKLADLERKVREVPKEDPRIASLTGDVRRAQEESAALKSQIADLQRKGREVPQEDPRIATLQKDVAALKERTERAEAKSAETERYFESMEQALIEARDEADKVEGLRAEIEKKKEECREHEEGLDQLAETVMELQHQLDSAAEAKPANAPVPAPEPAPAFEVVPRSPTLPEPPKAPTVQAPPPAPPPPPPLPKAEPIKIEIDLDPEPTPAPPPPLPPPPVVMAPEEKPAPKAVVVPPAMAVPGAPSAETTLRSNNTFGPSGEDGQPIYVLHEMLPKDTKGVMYRATERSDGRVFAVRFMAGQAGEEQTLAFEREVEKLTGLPHPNILHVQGSGRRKNRLYVMMDYIDAPTLGATKIHEIPRIVAILRDAAAAVHYAHEEEVFHGDLNLDAILVGKEDGKDLALVKDFGLAYLLETQTAGLRNPAFLPPEQVRVLKTPLSAAVDVYGLGATLFAALTGRAPFEGPDPAKIVKRVMIEEPPPVEKLRPDVPKAVGAIVRRAMAKERGVRYATAGELADALTKAL